MLCARRTRRRAVATIAPAATMQTPTPSTAVPMISMRCRKFSMVMFSGLKVIRVNRQAQSRKCVPPLRLKVGIIRAGLGLARDVDLFCEQLADAPLGHRRI